MAERNATIRLTVRPDNDPAAPLKAVANASKTAAAAVRNVKKDVADIVGPARSAQQVMSDLFKHGEQKAQQNAAKVKELTEAIRKLGATTQQVQQIAKQLGREFGVTTTQINQALKAAGQTTMAGRGGGAGGRGLGLGAFVGGFNMGYFSARFGAGAQQGLHSDLDAELQREAIRQAGEQGGLLGRISQGAFGDTLVAQALTMDDREAAADSARAAARARERLDASRQRVLQRMEEADQDSRDRQALDAARADRRDRRELSAFGAAAAGETFRRLQDPRVQAALQDQRTGGLAAARLGVDEDMQIARAQQAAALGRAGAFGAQAAAAGRFDEAAAAAQVARAPAGSTTVRELQANALRAELEALRRRSAELEKARAAEERIAELTAQQARIQADLTRAKAAELREQADQAKAEAKLTRDSIDAAAIAFGGETEEQQQQALGAARRFRRGGLGALTPEELAGLRQTGLFGGELDEQARQRAARSGFGELLGLSGAEGRAQAQEQRAADLQRAADQVKIQAEVQLSFDEARIQQALERALRNFDTRIEEIVVRIQQADRLKQRQAQFEPTR